ncbi:MAG: hypothetical protein ACK5C8_01535 [Roseiflexaceae bacterium]|jgi:hypothetical protein
MTVSTPWYEKTIWIVVWCIIVWPVGLYGMWRSSRALVWKIVVTVAIVAPYLIALLASMLAQNAAQ